MNVELNTLRAHNNRLTSQVSDLSSTIDGLRLQLATFQLSVPSAEFNTVCGKRDRYLSLLRSPVGQFDRFDE